MNFSYRIYTDIENERKFNKIFDKLNKRKAYPELYLVTLPIFDHGMFEIYSYMELMQHFYKSVDDKITILGISTSKAGAKELVADIISDMNILGFGFDSKAYISYLKNENIKEKAMENL